VSSLNQNLKGREYWQSLQQLAESPELNDRLGHEFTGYDPDSLLSMSRRGFMKIMGASMALAGLTLTGCRRWPEQHLRPFTQQPEGFKPGEAVHYASIFTLGGVSSGLLVRSYDGRPIKIEGNPLHGESLGATSGFAQASVLNLYDPDRSRYPIQLDGGKAARRSWAEFDLALNNHLSTATNIAVLSQAQNSPTFDRVAQAVKAKFPAATFHTWEPINRDNEIAGLQAATGQALRVDYSLEAASIIASFDEDLLGTHPAKLRYARGWGKGRRPENGPMNRLYAVEAHHSVTGSSADHRLPAKPSRIAYLLAVVAHRLGVASDPGIQLSELEGKIIDALVADLQANAGKSVVAVGAAQPAWAHALALAINHKLGNIGKTVTLYPEAQQPAGASLASLIERLNAGQVDTLVILDGNPVYDAPHAFAAAVAKAKVSIHLSLDVNETSKAVTWHLPLAHALECWGDGRSYTGTPAIQQPLILPLFDGRSPIELLAQIAGLPSTSGYDLVRDTFRSVLSASQNFEKAWRQVLHDGVVEGLAYTPVAITAVNTPAIPAYSASQNFELQFVADASTYDGRYANNGWLQEAPDPMTNLTWDNAALISKATADKLGVGNVGFIEISTPAGDKLKLASLILPGVAADTIILPLGYGRTACGKVGQGVGFNTYLLRRDGQSIITGASVARTAGSYKLALTTEHHLIDTIGISIREERVGKGGEAGLLVREATEAEYKKNKNVFRYDQSQGVTFQLYQAPHQFNDPHAWGMAIDMSACTGCNACVIACQAENNVPIVGKTEVLNNREMHWLRIDRYFKGDVENPDVVHMPMACVHCENAPCEQVCPVAATVHDAEGLNTMVYNRCIGTRYCSNNCPYKVRVFNYFDFHSKDPRGHYVPYLNIPDTQQENQVDKIKRMVFNPDVSVRMRGVMEKCTFCSHRIQDAKIHAKVQHAQGKRESDLVQDGEIVTACEASCSTGAIVFGNLNDPNSRVSRLHANSRAYRTLEVLNTRPRTLHMGIVRNPAFDKYPAKEAVAPGHTSQNTQQENA